MIWKFCHCMIELITQRNPLLAVCFILVAPLVYYFILKMEMLSYYTELYPRRQNSSILNISLSLSHKLFNLREIVTNHYAILNCYFKNNWSTQQIKPNWHPYTVAISIK
jgi:hypothetical protein